MERAKDWDKEREKERKTQREKEAEKDVIFVSQFDISLESMINSIKFNAFESHVRWKRDPHNTATAQRHWKPTNKISSWFNS